MSLWIRLCNHTYIHTHLTVLRRSRMLVFVTLSRNVELDVVPVGAHRPARRIAIDNATHGNRSLIYSHRASFQILLVCVCGWSLPPRQRRASAVRLEARGTVFLCLVAVEGICGGRVRHGAERAAWSGACRMVRCVPNQVKLVRAGSVLALSFPRLHAFVTHVGR